MNHREITKKYSELLNKAEFATGRKEVVGLLKKAAKLKSQIEINYCLLYTSPSPRDGLLSRMPSSA